MTKFTKEQLQHIVETDHVQCGDAAAMARQLLAGMEQEPVAWIVHARGGDQLTTDGGYVANAEGMGGIHSTPLYAAPQLPQPAVVDENGLLPCPFCGGKCDAKGWAGIAPGGGLAHGPECENCGSTADSLENWNRRAAMLQGSEPVSHGDELPMDYQQGHKDGLEWAARLAEANHPQTGDWLYDDPLELAKAIRKGPDMPVEPVQGWIPCSERIPTEIGRYWCYVEEQNSLGKSHYQWNCSWNGDRWWVESENGGRVTHWMPLPAAPQQEVK